jgi:hypothetical protein
LLTTVGAVQMQAAAASAAKEEECIICLSGGDEAQTPAPIQSGCACRGAAGLAHIACRIAAAEALAMGGRGPVSGWFACGTCRQHYTGAMQNGLAEKWWAAAKQLPETNADAVEERLAAAGNLADALSCAGKAAEAAAVERTLVESCKSLYGDDHPQVRDCRHL